MGTPTVLNQPGIIFDLDGTLLDSLTDIAAATNHMLTQLGYPAKPEHEINDLVGEGLRALIRDALPKEAATPEIIDRGLAIYRPYYAEHMFEHTKPYPGIIEMLDALNAHKLPMAVLSNKSDAPTKALTTRLLGDKYFSAVYGSREGIPKKPDPTAALEIAAMLQIAPENCLFVGDTAFDMQTAVNAKMHPIGVNWGFRPYELTTHGAKAVITTPNELVKFINIQ